MKRLRNKNQRRGKDGPVFPVPVAVFFGAVTALAVGFLTLDGRCDMVGRRIKELERQKAAQERQIVTEEYRWSNLTSPANIEKLLQAHNLALGWPEQKNVVWMRGGPETPGVAAPAAVSPRMYAQRAAAPRKARHD